MPGTRSWNPLGFVPAQVTFFVSSAYIALCVALLWVHLRVPSAPQQVSPEPGVNLTQAWLDLSYISDGYHPLDSKRNDAVRDFLLRRVEEILVANDADYKVVKERSHAANASYHPSGIAPRKGKHSSGPKSVTVFDDLKSNVTFVDDWKRLPWTCYVESTNVVVYIRGTDDDSEDWWTTPGRYEGSSGVLVNAHFDSVQSGYGATDDGVGVVTLLQLISHYTTEGNQPKRGLVALFNNGEELGLYGAHTYMRHPISQLPHMFLNLEGAGAGGRATLFRSTDAEVTSFYEQSPRPFGTVVSGDGFKSGFIRSGTDYSVFTNDLGMRGIDVAFFAPRSRYHTNQDDARDTSLDSLWHMLSASLATTKAMTSYSGDEFEGDQSRAGKQLLNSGSDGVWFDVFGRIFITGTLHTMFALSVALLVAGPVLLLALQVVLAKSGKWYPFSRKTYVHSSDDDEPIHLAGLRGFFRFPIAFVFSTAAVFALAYLLVKINPYIIYSSQWVVMGVMLSAWIVIAWFFLAGADRVRPTALQRLHILLWMYALSWALLVCATVAANVYQIAGGYFVVLYNATVLVALFISYFELWALPTKAKYARQVAAVPSIPIDESSTRARPGSRSSRSLLTAASRERRTSAEAADGDDATERTSLLRDSDGRSQSTFTGLGNKRRRNAEQDGLDDIADHETSGVYGDEQAWSGSLPKSTWILQFLVLVPLNVIIVGQIALLVTESMNQTAVDGSPVLSVYLMIAAFAVLLLLPVAPFMHRLSYRIPVLMLVVFIVCLTYSLTTFPFSREARFKFYFVEQVNLDTGSNNVTLHGLDGHLQDVISHLPSAAGQDMRCGEESSTQRGGGLQSCSFTGLAPNVVGRSSRNGTRVDVTKWVEHSISVARETATFHVRGRDSKLCRIVFDQPASSVVVEGGALDERFPPGEGISQVTLVGRDWDQAFRVRVQWTGKEGAKGRSGRVMCMWNDVNERGVIPAYDEVLRFAPVWSAVTKASDGLVEGWTAWRI